MPAALAILAGSQLAGEILRQLLHLPLPGPVIGMFLLVLLLVLRGRGRKATEAGSGKPPPLVTVAESLIGNMGLLFVPAGVGIITELSVLRQNWLPILAGLLVSTVLGLVATALVMHHAARPARARPAADAHGQEPH